MTRRAARVDATQSPIVDALRKAGATVQLLHTVGEGCPDALVGFRNVNYLMEFKSPTGKLTPDQVEWSEAWQGQWTIVRSPTDALLAIGAATPDMVRARSNYKAVRQWSDKKDKTA